MLKFSNEYCKCKTLSIICFKIKNPPPVELCCQKKEIPRISLIFFGLAQAPAKIRH
jgi:hypothetical protein